MSWPATLLIVPLFVLMPETRLRLLPGLMFREVDEARFRLLIVTLRTSIETAELGAPTATLYVVVASLLGTANGVQLAELLQLPVPPFQEELVWPFSGVANSTSSSQSRSWFGLKINRETD